MLELKSKSADKQQEKIRVMIFEGLQANALLVIKTLSVTPRPLYHWKAEDLSFLYVLLVWGVSNWSVLKLLCTKSIDISLEAKMVAESLATGPKRDNWVTTKIVELYPDSVFWYGIGWYQPKNKRDQLLLGGCKNSVEI